MAGFGEGMDPYTTLSTPTILRTRDIPWDIYMTARLISDRELQLLRRYDKKDVQYQGRLLKEVRWRGSLGAWLGQPADAWAGGVWRAVAAACCRADRSPCSMQLRRGRDRCPPPRGQGAMPRREGAPGDGPSPAPVG